MRSRVLAIAAILMAGATLPAAAAWDQVGSVGVSRYDDHASFGNLNGRIETLALQAGRNDVMCRDVTATFGNGNTREIFRGMLPVGRNVTVDLPGRDRDVERLDFDCHALGGERARVDIAANFDRYDGLDWPDSFDRR